MNSKAAAAIEKAREDRLHSNFKKALSRLEEGIEKFPKEFRLYTEAIDVSMESGEPLKAIQFFKKAQQKFSDDGFELWTFAAEKARTYNDAIVARFLLEQAIRSGDLTAAGSVLEGLSDHAANELLERIRTKKQTVSGSVGTGISAREDIASYTVIEALLCLRLLRFSEAMDGFIRALDENPEASKTLAPFLAEFEQRHGHRGEISYVLGCCYIVRTDYEAGFEKLAHAARLDPALVSKAIDRIVAVGENPEIPLASRNMTLARLYIGLGSLRQAAELLSAVLERDPLKASDIIDALRPVVETVGSELEPQFLFVEAAFAAGRRETALGQLRKIYQKRAHRTRLVEWLESRSQANRGSTETRLFFAETALNEELHGKALEIVKEILSLGREEEPVVKELLSKYQSVPLIRSFYNERFGASTARESRAGFEFERYDNTGLSPAEEAKPEEKAPDDRDPSSSEETGDTESSRLGVADLAFGDGERHPADPSRAATPRPSGIDNCDFSLSMHAAPDADSTPVRILEYDVHERCGATADADDESDLFDYLKRDFTAKHSARNVSAASSEPADLANDEAPSDDAPHETAEAPGTSPLDEPADLADAPASSWEEPHGAPDAPVATTVEPIEPTIEPADLPRDFDSLHRLLLDGKLDRARILDVIGRAFDEGRLDEMKELLAFEPTTMGEEIARKFQLARYYLAKDQPMPALIALKSVQLGALGKEERKNFLLRTAQCYRALHNYEAAHSVYLRIMSEYPESSDVERMAQSNYDRYVEAAAGAALALEKTTNL